MLIVAVAVGAAFFIAGVLLGVLAKTDLLQLLSVVLGALGSAIMFPVLVSFAYDSLRERWLGDEVWRLFGELADAGILRVYKDREFTAGRENAQTRLSDEFKQTQHQIQTREVLMMGPTLRVFFNPLGPFYRDIRQMVKAAGGAVTIRAMIERADSPAVADRIAIEEPHLPPDQKPQTERDADSTVATLRELTHDLGNYFELRRFRPAPYCTAIIFPDVAFYSPNLIAHAVPVRLPMILFRSGSHGYNVLLDSFEHLWKNRDTQVVPLSPRVEAGAQGGFGTEKPAHAQNVAPSRETMPQPTTLTATEMSPPDYPEDHQPVSTDEAPNLEPGN